MTTIRAQLNEMEVLNKITHYRVQPRAPWSDLINKFFGQDWDSAEQRPLFKFHTTDAFLDVEFSAGYGGEGQPAINFYTSEFIIITVCYDGATWLDIVPLKHNDEDTFQHYGGG